MTDQTPERRPDTVIGTPGSLDATAAPRNINRPRPNALTAAATRLTKASMMDTPVKRKGYSKDDRISDAWDMFDLLGEQRFLATTLAGRMGQARLYLGRIDPDNPTADPERVEDEPELMALVESLGNNPAQLGQFLTRIGVNLFVPGGLYLVGIPEDLFNDDGSIRELFPGEVPGEDMDLASLEWHALSTREFTRKDDEKVVGVRLIDGRAFEVDPDRLMVIHCWRPHPAEGWRYDSPVLSSLPVLRELVGLTMHVSAQIDSRLAGAGILLVADSVKTATMRNAGVEAENEDDDPFTDALIEAMTTPISDRSSAAAVVPYVWTVPLKEGQKVEDLVSHLSFAGPLDPEARQLREEAIRRVALGEDAPPELLLGVAGMNHWGAWLVREDVITTHVEPPLAIFCDAVTREFLWTAAIAMGRSRDDAHRYVIWYSVDHLIARPNEFAEAKELHEAGVISDSVLRDAAGYDDDDAPEDKDPAIAMVLQMLVGAPSLAQNPGIPALVEQIRAAMTGEDPEAAPGQDTDAIPEAIEEAEESEEEDRPADGPPNPDDSDGPPATVAASAAPLEGTILEPHELVPLTDDRTWIREFAAAMRDDRPIHVNVETPPVTVNVPEGLVRVDVPTPEVHVASPEVHVAAPEVFVAAPQVNVEPTPVTFTPTIDIPAPTVNVEAPTVHVAAPDTPQVLVNVEPTPVTVEAPVVQMQAAQPRKRRVLRDKDDRIIGVEDV